MPPSSPSRSSDAAETSEMSPPRSTAIGRVLVGPEQRQRPPGNLRDGVLPRTDDAARGSRIAVHLGCDVLAELDDAFDALAVGQRQGELRGSPRPIPAG